MSTKKQEQQLFEEIKDTNGDKKKVLNELKDLVYTVDYCKNVYFWTVSRNQFAREMTCLNNSKLVILKLKSGGKLVLETEMEQIKYTTFTKCFELVDSNLNIETINLKTIKALIVKLEREIYDKKIIKINKETTKIVSRDMQVYLENILKNELGIVNYKITTDLNEQMLIIKYKDRYDCYIYLSDILSDNKAYLDIVMSIKVDTESEIYKKIITWYSKVNRHFKVA
ncbi:hypothetical protein ACYT4P_00310 [Enterococcus gallinarum]|jgi:hypothetical protein